jgi:hypothetical protein
MNTADPLQAYHQAHDTYLEQHPIPKVLDYTCPRCKADPGHPCRRGSSNKPTPVHAPRHDRYAKALLLRQAEAIEAGRVAAYNAATFTVFEEDVRQ